MRISLVVVLVLLQFTVMYAGGNIVPAQNEEIIKNPLTIEHSFGADETNLPDEYLLVNPSSLAVNDNGDVIVPDESFLKLYDTAGRPKSMLGGPGEGPGEFSRSPSRAFISETGYITAIASGANVYPRYNIYDPGYNFVEQVNIQYRDVYSKFYEESGLQRIQFRESYWYSPEEFLFAASGQNTTSQIRGTTSTGKVYGTSTIDKTINAWIYQSGSTIQTVISEENSAIAEDGKRGFREEGVAHYGLLRDRRIVYTHAAIHKSIENNIPYYSLFVYSLNSLQKTEIKQPYIQVAFPDSVLILCRSLS